MAIKCVSCGNKTFILLPRKDGTKVKFCKKCQNHFDLLWRDFTDNDDCIYPLKKFIAMCKDGSFVDYDGYGAYSDGKRVTNIHVCPSQVLKGRVKRKFSHVVWYNR